MPYQTKTVKDIPNWLQCPICDMYQTKHRSYLMNHFKKCDEYDGHIDDVLQYDINKDTTVEDFIEQQVNVINITKKLIQTNELNAIQNQSLDEIRLYIKNKLLQDILPYDVIEMDALNIYELFFGESEESKNRHENEFMTWFNRNGDYDFKNDH